MLRSGTPSATSSSISGMAEDAGLGKPGEEGWGAGGGSISSQGGKTKGILVQEMQESEGIVPVLEGDWGVEWGWGAWDGSVKGMDSP